MSTTTTRMGPKRQRVAGRRDLSSEEYRVLAEHREAQEAQQRKDARREKLRRAAGVPAKRWATEENTRAAARQETAHRKTQRKGARGEAPSGEQLREQRRKAMIKSRNRRRRLPWYGTAGTAAAGMAGHGAAELITATTAVPASIPAGILAAAPAAASLAIAANRDLRYRQRLEHAARQAGGQQVDCPPKHRKWAPELLLGGLAASGAAYWIGMDGLTWPSTLAMLLGTIAAGWRWWKDEDNRIGPGVPPLQPAQPAQPEPAPVPTEAPEVDHYARDWNAGLDLGRLTNRREIGNAVQYDVELPPGKATVKTAQNSLDAIASALGLDVGQVFVEQAPADENGWRPANRARLTIVVEDVTRQQRFYHGPGVEVAQNGSSARLTNLARFRDGQGEARVTMWNPSGMVSLAIFGGTGGGKSAAANVVACGALSSGLLNSIYVDFKGNSSGALRSRARIVVVGTDAVRDVQRLMRLLVNVRMTNDPRDIQFPTQARPGWFVLMDEITKGIKGDVAFSQEMERMATTVRSQGIWLVATTQDMHSTAWGSTNTRAAFARQAVAFHMNTDSDQLINGLTYKPSQLPTYDQEEEAAPGREGQPIGGFAVHANTYRPNVPCRWDWLPADDDPVDEEPPYRASAAFDAFFNEPGIADDEYAALVEALGPPNRDGRWVIGIGGTHRFRGRDQDTEPVSGARPVRTGGFGTPRDQHGDSTSQLTESQRSVLAVIEGGTTRTGDIVDALPRIGRTTVHDAITALMGKNLIHRAKQGHYGIGPDPDGADRVDDPGPQSGESTHPSEV